MRTSSRLASASWARRSRAITKTRSSPWSGCSRAPCSSRGIDLPLTLEMLGVSSYQGGTETTGEVRITSDVTKPMAGKHLLIVEDIIDTGLTMKFLLENLGARHPASLKICTLLEKPARARTKVPIDYKGFVIEDKFVVGYGLDYDEVYRNLPFIGVMKGR